jgi:hypothetical protein
MGKKRTTPKQKAEVIIKDKSFTKKKKKINSYDLPELVAFVNFLNLNCPNSKVHVAAQDRLSELLV